MTSIFQWYIPCGASNKCSQIDWIKLIMLLLLYVCVCGCVFRSVRFRSAYVRNLTANGACIRAQWDTRKLGWFNFLLQIVPPHSARIHMEGKAMTFFLSGGLGTRAPFQQLLVRRQHIFINIKASANNWREHKTQTEFTDREKRRRRRHIPCTWRKHRR